MKKIHSMMLMLLVAVMSLCVQSCSKEETTIPGSIERVTYSREDFSSSLKFQDRAMSAYADVATVALLTQEQQQTLLAFFDAIKQGDSNLQSMVEGGTTPSDSKVLNAYKKYLEDFTSGKGFEGYIKITKTKNGDTSDVGTISFSK